MIRKERTMLLLKSNYTAEDYWNLPEGERAELIDGQIYNMAPPSQFHQDFLPNIPDHRKLHCRSARQL